MWGDIHLETAGSPLGDAELNEEFYERDPSLYFMVRMAHLALIGSHDERHAARLAEGISLRDSLQLKLEGAAAKPAGEVPSLGQQFAAVEGQLLLSQVAETLMRYVHAHAEHDPCPWKRMAKETHARTFKEWVTANLVACSDDELDALIVDRLFVLGDAGPRALEVLRTHLRSFAELFLDADGYNAGKHGLGLSGRALGIKLRFAEEQVLEGAGLAISFLSSKHDGTSRTWYHHTALASLEVTIGLIYVATRLLDGIRDRGAGEHLDYEPGPYAGVGSLDTLLDAFDQQDTRILEIIRTLTEDGTSPDVRVRSAHFGPEPIQ